MSAAHQVLFDAPGPKARARHRITAVVVALAAVALLLFVGYKLQEKGNLTAAKWQPFLTPDPWVYYLLPGIGATLLAAVISMATSGVFGLAFGMGRLSQVRAVRWVAGVVVEFFRAVPVLVMMIFAFWMFTTTIPVVPSGYIALAGVIVGLTFYNGSVFAELIRSGIFGLPKGQREAGLTVGLTPFQTLRMIELPQALTAMLPSLVAQIVVILKDTAIGYIITYPELLKVGADQLGTAYANVVPAFMVVAVIYILINYAVSKMAEYLEGRLRRRGHTAAVLAPDEIQDGA
ncbi:MAG: amino acid ABC transporter permease [Dermatophilaceae bacterium]